MMAYELCTENIGIRVNAICPGYFPTELTAGTRDEKNKTTWPEEPFKKEMKRVGTHVPAGRPGYDAEIGSVSRRAGFENYYVLT